MIEYIKDGRVKIDRSKFAEKLVTIHDPCNYGRKSLKMFGKSYADDSRWIVDKICEKWVNTYSDGNNNFCCGGGGGGWALPFEKERLYYGRKKVEQINKTNADIVVAPCHNCRDQIMKSLAVEYEVKFKTYYTWELLAESIIVSPWSKEKIESSKIEAADQWKRLNFVTDEDDE